MITYVVSFDLGDNFDQTEFWEIFGTLGEAQQITSSTWLLVSEKSATEIRDSLTPAMDSSERLMVQKSASPAAWKNIMSDSKWVIENIGNKRS